MTQPTLPLFPDERPETPAIGVARSQGPEPSREAPHPASFELDFTQNRPPAVQAKIEDGMRRADENADHYWKRIVDGCILAAARRLEYVTVDDVLDELEKVNEARAAQGLAEFETHNQSALGPAMKRAMRDKIVVATDRVQRSRRDIKHGNRHTVWQSKVYEGGKRGTN